MTPYQEQVSSNQNNICLFIDLLNILILTWACSLNCHEETCPYWINVTFAGGNPSWYNREAYSFDLVSLHHSRFALMFCFYGQGKTRVFCWPHNIRHYSGIDFGVTMIWCRLFDVKFLVPVGPCLIIGIIHVDLWIWRYIASVALSIQASGAVKLITQWSKYTQHMVLAIKSAVARAY